jgi:hypothetical protein
MVWSRACRTSVVASLSNKQGTDSGLVLEVPASSQFVMTLDSSVIGLLGGNPVVEGREETLPPVGGRLCVQSCWAITKSDTVWQYQQ